MFRTKDFVWKFLLKSSYTSIRYACPFCKKLKHSTFTRLKIYLKIVFSLNIPLNQQPKPFQLPQNLWSPEVSIPHIKWTAWIRPKTSPTWIWKPRKSNHKHLCTHTHTTYLYLLPCFELSWKCLKLSNTYSYCTW